MTQQLLDALPPVTNGKVGWPWTETQPNTSFADAVPVQWPRISIVTPSYNQAQYLEETIRSVLLQGYPNLEYFVMDGGSTDSSLDIIKSYAPWLTAWESRSDGGQSHAINKGFRQATGDILAWINSDDLYFDKAFFRAAEHFNRYPDLGLLHGMAEIVNESGDHVWMRGGTFDVIEAIEQAQNPIAQSSTFFKASVVHRLGYLDPHLHMSMDWDLFIRIALDADCLFVPELWSKLRQTPETKTSSNLIGFGPDNLRVIEKVYACRGSEKRLELVRRKAFAAALVRSAKGNLRASKQGLARLHLLKAILIHPGAAIRNSRGMLRSILLKRD
jgi:glycosyltransferase involved in cell wall biosynthesis